LFEPFDTSAPGIGLTAVLWSWQLGKPPTGAMKIDFTVLPVEGFTSCERDSSTPTTFGGQAAWQADSPPDGTQFPGVAVIRYVATDRGGLRYCITGLLFEGYDPLIFERIVKSFKFAN
jgi:hypothetical protein